MATTTSAHRTLVPRLREEVTVERLRLHGQLPPWLTGTLVRLTSADFGTGDSRVRHLFDGLAMLHKFAFADGSVAYANRFVDSRARRARAAEGRIAFREFATDPCRSLFRRVASLFSSDFTDNANVNVTRLGREFLAMTETPLPIRFDPRTLESAGVEDAFPPDPGAAAHVTAHPHRDRLTGGLVHYAAVFGPRPRYEVYVTTPRDGSAHAEVLASHSVRRPSYMHSFAITDRHVVLTENPLTVNPVKLALSGRPFIDNYEWRPERGTRVHVFDRADGSRVGAWQMAPFFCFHHVNAFEDGSRLVVDLLAHDDASVIDNLFLDRLDREDYELAQARPRRMTLDLRGGGAEDEFLSDVRFELPRINYAAANGRRHRYVYGTGYLPRRRGAPAPPLVKLDVEDGSVTRWHEDGWMPGEPVFVGAPQGRREDDGVVLSVATDTRGERSALLVLDASSLEQLSRAEAPHAVPQGFHGDWLGEVEADRRS